MTDREHNDLLRRVEGLERSRRRWRLLASLAWAALTLALSYQIVSAVGASGEPGRVLFVSEGGGAMIVDEIDPPPAPAAPAVMPQADEEPGVGPSPAKAR